MRYASPSSLANVKDHSLVGVAVRAYTKIASPNAEIGRTLSRVLQHTEMPHVILDWRTEESTYLDESVRLI